MPHQYHKCHGSHTDTGRPVSRRRAYHAGDDGLLVALALVLQILDGGCHLGPVVAQLACVALIELPHAARFIVCTGQNVRATRAMRPRARNAGEDDWHRKRHSQPKTKTKATQNRV